MSRAGRERRSSVRVGAWRTSSRRAASRRAAQQTVHCGRASAPSPVRSVSSPWSRTTSHRLVPSGPWISVRSPSVVRRQARPAMSMWSRPSSESSRSVACASNSASSSAGSTPSRSGSRTSVSKPSGTVSSVGHTSRRTGTRSSRPMASRVRAAENSTPPDRETTRGASVTVSTAANPTPNRPTPCCLAEARREASEATPAWSSARPVLATCSSRPASWTRNRPPCPAASAAFCASSTSTRSR